jgi:hypothetical protein
MDRAAVAIKQWARERPDLALTAAGRHVIDETITRRVANEEKLLSVRTTAEQEKLNALLRKLISGL